jgi:protein gp37
MKGSKIQWTDDTVNPTMGCLGCELFPKPREVLEFIDTELSGVLSDWFSGRARIEFTRVIRETFDLIEDPGEGHRTSVTTTNIVHTTAILREELSEQYGASVGYLLEEAVKEKVKCYAAILHLNKAMSLRNPHRQANSGYAPTFEQIRQYAGRAQKMARSSDLFGRSHLDKPWAEGLPRLIFVGDMGDMFARRSDFEFLNDDLMAAIKSVEGQRHLWLLLTKRPQNMAAFAHQYGAFPANVCCMTTVTSQETLHRIDDLRLVDCSMRGLSVEPLWERLPAGALNLQGIHWLIAGGESGAKARCKPFHLEWAQELRDICRQSGVAYFLKQLGSNAFLNGESVALANRHGGDWQEWPEDLRVREFPEGFHSYRRLANAA